MLERWSPRRTVPSHHAMNTLDTLDTQANLVASRPRILHFLREIDKDNLSLSIIPAEHPLGRVFTTRILRLEEDNILLHQLTPGDWREFIEEDARVFVSCQLASGAIRFAARLSPLDGSGMACYCLLTLPERMDRRQLRASYRVSLLQHGARYSAVLPDGSELDGKVCDLSLGGLLCLSDARQPAVARGEVLSQCRVSIPGMPDLAFEAMVCHRVEAGGIGAARIGLKFIRLSAVSIATIRRTIARVERENIRRRSAS